MDTLIKDIEPIDKMGRNLLKEENFDEIIDSIIELPFRNVCRWFREKGIETVMSSANKNNILKPEDKRTEKEDVFGNGQQWFYPRPTYDDAGKGYVWIMLNFDTLSDENKDILFSLEEATTSDGKRTGDKAIWFVHPCTMGNLEYDLRCGKHTYEGLLQFLSEDEIPKGVEFDPKLAEFEKRHIVLGYNGGIYPMETVFLRMPVDEKTTVKDVEEYYGKFIKVLRDQNVDKNIKKKDKEDEEREMC